MEAPEGASCWVEVDCDAITANTAAIAAHVGTKVAVMAMLTGNAYGHGITDSARAACAGGATWLGVSTAADALRLRSAGIDCRILVTGWVHPSDNARLLAAGVDLTVYDAGEARLLGSAATAGNRARVHLRIDTGANVLGVRTERLGALLDSLSTYRDVFEVVAAYTHFADSAAVDELFTRDQLGRFMYVVPRVQERFPDVLLHCADSAALLTLPASHFDIVRPGVALYGHPPVMTTLPLRPALQVKTRVTQVKRIMPGETVGPGRQWAAPDECTVATLGAGQETGLFAAPNTGAALVNGVRCPVRGAAGVGEVAVEITDVDDVGIGDVAVLLGSSGAERQDAADVAASMGRNVGAMLSGISAALPRRYRTA